MISLGSGYIGADLKAKASPKYSTVTIGCEKRPETSCSLDEMIHVLSKRLYAPGEWEYKIGYHSISVGYVEPVIRICPDYLAPFDPGDYAIYIRYEDRYDQGCWSLRPDYTGTQLRRVDNRTDSETRQ